MLWNKQLIWNKQLNKNEREFFVVCPKISDASLSLPQRPRVRRKGNSGVTDCKEDDITKCGIQY